MQLLQVALGTRSTLYVCPTEREWREIYRLATVHVVVGISFAGVEKISADQHPPIDLLIEWFGMSELIRLQNVQANADGEKVTDIFRKAGFYTSIMKGQGNALLYGELASVRTPGDIDIWVKHPDANSLKQNFKRVNTFVQSLNKTREINELEIQVRGVCKTPVEVHYRPFIIRNPWMNHRLQSFFSQESSTCFRGDIYTSIRFNIVHQLAHIRLHLFTEGIGVKQLLDYYFVLKAFHAEGAANYAEQCREVMIVIKNTGMKRFAEAMMWVMKEVLLLPMELLLCAPDEEGGRLLMQDVLQSGNFGRGDVALEERKQQHGYGFWALFVRNLRYNCFDRWDWIYGPLWRIYYRVWHARKGYK